MRRGFGKAQPPSKGKQKAKDKLETYTLCHFGRDGVFRVLNLAAKSDEEATRKFNAFLDVLDLCLSQASDEEILSFIEENPIDDGVEP
jgi:exonuclease V gamma subunit